MIDLGFLADGQLVAVAVEDGAAAGGECELLDLLLAGLGRKFLSLDGLQKDGLADDQRRRRAGKGKE